VILFDHSICGGWGEYTLSYSVSTVHSFCIFMTLLSLHTLSRRDISTDVVVSFIRDEQRKRKSWYDALEAMLLIASDDYCTTFVRKPLLSI
jgi:hypothetical protein